MENVVLSILFPNSSRKWNTNLRSLCKSHRGLVTECVIIKGGAEGKSVLCADWSFVQHRGRALSLLAPGVESVKESEGEDAPGCGLPRRWRV